MPPEPCELPDRQTAACCCGAAARCFAYRVECDGQAVELRAPTLEDLAALVDAHERAKSLEPNPHA